MSSAPTPTATSSSSSSAGSSGGSSSAVGAQAAGFAAAAVFFLCAMLLCFTLLQKHAQPTPQLPTLTDGILLPDYVQPLADDDNVQADLPAADPPRDRPDISPPVVRQAPKPVVAVNTQAPALLAPPPIQPNPKPPAAPFKPIPPAFPKSKNTLLTPNDYRRENANITNHLLYASLVDQACTLPPATIEKFVARQLAPWLPPAGQRIPLEDLDDVYCVRKQIIRISYQQKQLRYVNWQLLMDFNRAEQSLWFIRLATLRAEQRGKPIPNFEIVLNPTDKTAGEARGTHRVPERPQPLFCNAKCENDSSISFPIMFHAQFGSKEGAMSLSLYDEKYHQLDAMGGRVPWRHKRPKVFYSGDNLRGNRANLYSAKHPALEILAVNVPLADYGHYKYLIYAFGHSGWSQRLRELAFINAVVLVEGSNCHEYYQDVFEDSDFVGLRADFSNLEAVVEQLMATDSSKLEAMAASWRQKGRAVLSLPCVLDYIEALLRRYASLQDFIPPPRPTWLLYELGMDKISWTGPQPLMRDCFKYLG